jgi:hypothetical protein
VDNSSCAEKYRLPGLANGALYGPGIVLDFYGAGATTTGGRCSDALQKLSQHGYERSREFAVLPEIFSAGRFNPGKREINFHKKRGMKNV